MYIPIWLLALGLLLGVLTVYIIGKRHGWRERREVEKGIKEKNKVWFLTPKDFG